MALRRQRQRFEVDLGVFPDLRVDQAFERPGEHDFEHSLEKARLRRTAWFRRWLAAALDADVKPSST
jgi:hypothetical protein